MKHFTGLSMPRGLSFSDTWTLAITHAADIQSGVFVVGLFTLLLGIAVKRWLPNGRADHRRHARRLGAGGRADRLERHHAADGWRVACRVAAVVGTGVRCRKHSALWGASGVVAVTLLALTEAVSIARALAARSGQHVDGNQEFIGQGLSNLFGSFFSGYVATGSFNRSGD